MNQEELSILKQVESTPDRVYPSMEDYIPEFERRYIEPGTLLYGYDCDRNTWHVFNDHFGLIYLYVYKHTMRDGYIDIKKIEVSSDGLVSLEELVPNKRLYPQYCDFKFCSHLKSKGVNLPFTVWSEPKPLDGAFVGQIF